MHIIYLHETIIKTILLYNYCLLIKTGEGQRAGLASRHLSQHLISASCTGSYHCDDSLTITLILAAYPLAPKLRIR